MKMIRTIFFCLSMVFTAHPLSLDEESKLLKLAQKFPEILSSPASIPLLERYQQDELLTAMSGYATKNPGTDITQMMQDTIGRLHRNKLCKYERPAVRIGVCRLNEVYSTEGKISLSSDGEFLIHEKLGVYDITEQNAREILFDKQKKGKWVLGKAGTIVYHINYEDSRVAGYKLTTQKKIFCLAPSACLFPKMSVVSAPACDGSIIEFSQFLAQQESYLSRLPKELYPTISIPGIWQKPKIEQVTCDDRDHLFAVVIQESIIKLYTTIGELVCVFGSTAPYSQTQAGLFSPDSRWFIARLLVASGQTNNHLQMRDMQNVHTARLLEGISATFSPDGVYVAVANTNTGGKNSITVLDTKTLKTMHVIMLDTIPDTMRMSPNNKRLIIEARMPAAESDPMNKTDEIWSLPEEKCLYKSLKDRFRYINDAGTKLISAYVYGHHQKAWESTTFLDVESGNRHCIHGEAITGYCGDNEGRYIFQVQKFREGQLINGQTGLWLKDVPADKNQKGLNSFLPGNKFVVLLCGELHFYQLFPVDWDKLTAHEKVMLMILKGKPYNTLKNEDFTSVDSLKKALKYFIKS